MGQKPLAVMYFSSRRHHGPQLSQSAHAGQLGLVHLVVAAQKGDYRRVARVAVSGRDLPM